MAFGAVTGRIGEQFAQRSFLSRIADVGSVGLNSLCGILLLGSVLTFGLVGYTVSVSERGLDVSTKIEEARIALLREHYEETRYGGESIIEARARAAEAQSASRQALHLLSTTTDSTRGHLRINDETLGEHALHAEAVNRLLSALGPVDMRTIATPSTRARFQLLISDVDSSFVAVERSLADASAEVLTDSRVRINSLQTLQSIALVTGPLLFILGLGGIAFLGEAVRADQRRRQERVERDAAEVCFNERRFRSLVYNATDLVLLCDASGRIVFASPSAESGWGLVSGSVPGRSLIDLLDAPDRAAAAEFVATAPTADRPAAIRLETRIADGFGQWQDADLVLHNLLSDPDVQAVVCVARDIGHRKERERSLHGAALFDPVTGLPNARLLHDRLEQALLRSRRQNALVGVVLVGAVPASDSTWPAGGVDIGLVERIGRLRGTVRVTDTIARLHDDCLAVVLENVGDQNAMRILAERLATAANHTLDAHSAQHGHQSLPPGLGIAFAAAADTDADSLLQHAQLALDRAPPGGWFLFDPALRERTLDRTELTGDLRAADLPIEMELRYQPVVQLDGRSLLGFGTGIVWAHPVQGPIDPGVLRTLAEEAGLVVPIGRWAIEEACRQLSVWQKQARLDPALSIGVKLLAGHFHSPSLCADVIHAIGAAGIRAACLQLEIPEQAVLQDIEATVTRLWELRDIGVRVAVDGLGSGYTAVPILRQLPVDLLVVDVATAGMDDHDSMEKACAMAALGRSLQMQVVANGIATEEQATLLMSWGCDVGQGELFDRPMSAEDATLAVRNAARARAIGMGHGPVGQRLRLPPRDPLAMHAAGHRPRPRRPQGGEWATDRDIDSPETGRGPNPRTRQGGTAAHRNDGIDQDAEDDRIHQPRPWDR